MWKCASRNLRATLKKGVLRSTTVLSTKVPQNKDLQCLLRFAPALLEQCNQFYNFYRGKCENFSEKKKDREGPNEKKTSFLGGLDNNFFDALKWSGAFVLGYYLLQPFGCKRKFSNSDLYERQSFSKKSAYHETLLYLIDAISIKRYNCVLPEVQAAKSSKANEKQFTKPVLSNVKTDHEKFSNLEKAHRKVLGSLCNFLGTQSIQSGRYKEALEYFMQSADEENAAGIFNLGICHEKGLGTNKNFERAAELYQRAADLGHAAAMYNLGVFYAQGLGGMEPNMDQAKELFTAAANLGQADAAKALRLEKQGETHENTLISEQKRQSRSTFNNFIYDHLLNQTASNMPGHCDVCNDNLKNSFFEYPEGKEIQLSLGSDSGVLDLSPHDEPSDLVV